MDHDGNNQNEIMLLDANRCPTLGQIMGLQTKGKGEVKDLAANFVAFKFPSSQVGPDVTALIQQKMALSQIFSTKESECHKVCDVIPEAVP